VDLRAATSDVAGALDDQFAVVELEDDVLLALVAVEAGINKQRDPASI